jgi:hypothetical protein
MTAAAWAVLLAASQEKPFVLRAVDEATGRGVPLVEFRTTNHVALHTDNAGVAAFDEPGLTGRRVWFSVESDGYEAPADGFGFRGAAFETRPGGEGVVRLRRLQPAERLYRITGQGLYHHSVRAGLPVPLKEPLLNAGVMGQDSAGAVVVGGVVRWFWGDTSLPGYPLGHFGTATATSELGGLVPNIGIELRYAVNEKGESRPTFDLGRPGPVWVHAPFVVKDPEGKDRVLGEYERVDGAMKRLELGIAAFDESTARFQPLRTFGLDEERHPFGQVFRDGEHFYFATPYPLLRVRARWEDVLEPEHYEAFTCLAEGAPYEKAAPRIVRDAEGRAVYAWRRAARPVGPERQEELIRGGFLKPEEAWIRTVNAADGRPVTLHRGSVRWNAHRKRWVAVATRFGGESPLGDVYYAEAEAPQGPWPKALKVLGHRKHTFYNPVHHDFFDEDGGRRILFEGTFTTTFSKDAVPVPRWEYNQVMYRLDLDDPRLAPLR